MAAHYKCSACSGEHPLAPMMVFGNRQAFETSAITGLTLPCPQTGKAVTVEQKDMFWKDDG